MQNKLIGVKLKLDILTKIFRNNLHQNLFSDYFYITENTQNGSKQWLNWQPLFGKEPWVSPTPYPKGTQGGCSGTRPEDMAEIKPKTLLTSSNTHATNTRRIDKMLCKPKCYYFLAKSEFKEKYRRNMYSNNY